MKGTDVIGSVGSVVHVFSKGIIAIMKAPRQPA